MGKQNKLAITVVPMNRQLSGVYFNSHLVPLGNPEKLTYGQMALGRLLHCLSLRGPWTCGEVSWQTVNDSTDEAFKKTSVPLNKGVAAMKECPILLNASKKEWVDVEVLERVGEPLYHPLPLLAFNHYEVDIMNPAFKDLFTRYLQQSKTHLIDQVGAWHRSSICAMTRGEFQKFMNRHRQQNYKDITQEVKFTRYE